MKVMPWLSAALWFSCGSLSMQAVTLELKQPREGEPAQILSSSEREQLGDPFFVLVLKDNADAKDLARIEELIQPNLKERQTFVVDEEIANLALNQARRSVITFTGSNKGEVLTANVMLSVFFGSNTFPQPPSIEAWGWDNFRGRYNYYKLDNSGTPDLAFAWKFRASSVGADVLTGPERRNSCLACHINGGPIMKELAFPWNNWHSTVSHADYLISPQGWPVARDRALARGRLKGAETLEVDGIIPGIKQFNTRRINQSLVRQDADGNIAVNAQGFAQVAEGKRLLRPLFSTTEYNVISSGQKSGLHPFSAKPMTGPAREVELPNTFFLNSNLIAGGTVAGYVGLGIQEANNFGGIARVKPEEYKKLVENSQIALGGRRPADADFAWFVPEPSHIDNDMIDRLMQRGIVSRNFVASVLIIDLEKPVLSVDRESLLKFVPDRFFFRPLKPGEQLSDAPDSEEELTKQVIAALEGAALPANSAAAKWLQVLKRTNCVAQLREQVKTYLQRTSDDLAKTDSRDRTLQTLFDKMLARREAVLKHDLLSALNETGDKLFPVTETLIVNPHHGR